MKLIKIFLSVILLFTVLSGKEETIQLNINDMEISEFIKMVAKLDNKNILIPLNVRGKVNYISKKPIPKKNLFALLQNILKEKGFTIIDTHKGFLKVSRISEANKNSPSINKKVGEMVYTAIIDIKNMEANKLSGQIKYFKGLGSWTEKGLKHVVKKDGLGKMIEFLEWDENAQESIDSWLNSKRADDRKEMIVANDFDLIKL